MRAVQGREVITGDCALSAFPSAGASTPPVRDGRLSFLTSISAAHGGLDVSASRCRRAAAVGAHVCRFGMQSDQRRAENNCGRLSLSNMELDPTFACR